MCVCLYVCMFVCMLPICFRCFSLTLMMTFTKFYAALLSTWDRVQKELDISFNRLAGLFDLSRLERLILERVAGDFFDLDEDT